MVYDRYVQYVKTIGSKHEPFKSNPEYTYMLEHVTPELGEKYLDLLRSEFSMTDNVILDFCNKNDSFGTPHTFIIRDLQTPVSPTSLRYLYQASVILKQSGDTDSFVEVGGGYGGLCSAIFYLSKQPIREYHIVDLEPILRLQKMVLAEYTNVNYHCAETFGINVPEGCFFISNYCFSEIDEVNRSRYVECLLPKCPHGFLAWNFIPIYDFGKQLRVETEKPLTFNGNYFVYF